jgi:hypothetical protein
MSTKRSDLASSDSDQQKPTKDIWDKLPVVTSLLGAVVVPVMLLWGGQFLERSLKSQNEMLENKRIALQLTTAREQSDSDLKASMFTKLLEKYESSAQQEDPKQKLFFLELLVYNFGETLTLTPIINDLLTDFKKDPSSYQSLANRLSTALREAGSRQIASLMISGDQKRFTLQKGQVKRFVLIYCREDEKLPIAERFPVEVKYIKSEPDHTNGGESILNHGALLEVTRWKRNVNTGKSTSVRRTFVLDQSDLPLIDNMPLSDGLRFALMIDHESDVPEDQSATMLPILALGFSSESTMMKEKPSGMDYVKYLNNNTVINPDSKQAKENTECTALGPNRSLGFVEPLPTDFQNDLILLTD